MFLVGLTGGIASGKSTVSKMFQELGVPVIDADIMARRVVEPGRKAWFAIHREFGDDMFLEDGELDREALGKVVFHDPSKRIILNRITHPEIYKEMCWETVRYFFRGYQFVILDLPLLYETGTMLPYMHQVIVVSCEDDLQLQRLRSRDLRLNEADARSRIASQFPLQHKCEMANAVIDNSGTKEETREQVVRLYSALSTSNMHWKVRAVVGAGLVSLATLTTWITARIIMSRL